MCLVGADWFWQSYSKAEDTLHFLLLKYKILKAVENQSCQKLISDSIYGSSTKQVDAICANYNIREPDHILQFLYVCTNKFGREWSQFK